jgi:hypothetical protein
MQATNTALSANLALDKFAKAAQAQELAIAYDASPAYHC